jgi:type IV pilus assembly protein PilB
MASRVSRPVGEILIENGVISPLDLERAMLQQRISGEFLGRALVKMGLAKEQDVIDALGMQAGMDKVDLNKMTVKEDIIRIITADIARFYNVIPIRRDDDVLTVAMAYPRKVHVLDELAALLGCRVKGAISTIEDVDRALEQNYSYKASAVSEILDTLIEEVGQQDKEELMPDNVLYDIDNLAQLANEPEIIKLVNLVLMRALQTGSSDIHFEPYEDEMRIRLRIDGVLYEITYPPAHLSVAIASRVKVISGLDIGERRMPQDGRVELQVGGTEIDLRVSTMPTLFGETVVMRILDRTSVKLSLDALGFGDEDLVRIRDIIRRPNGILLSTGPTGCGKTTTLYACLSELNAPEVKIITTEDPVEFPVDGIIQVAIKEEIGLTFAGCLRSILRQDPDIVMVGEIRDLETCQIAVEASLTGHIVLSTLHTNDAPETMTRLLDMGVEPFLITSSVEGIIAQRLVRVLCRFCREPYEPDEDEMEQVGTTVEELEGHTVYREKGCPLCEFRGFRGRTGIFELLAMDDFLREMVNKHCTAIELRQEARKRGLKTLRERGIETVLQGITTFSEILASTDKFD